VLARSNQQQTAYGWNQRLNLRSVGGVVHQQQRAPALEHGEIESTQLAFTLREFGGGMVSANDVGQRLSHGERLCARAFEIEKELGVGIAWLEQFDELERQSSLTDAAQPLQTGDGNATGFDCSEQLFQLIFAAGKVSG